MDAIAQGGPAGQGSRPGGACAGPSQLTQSADVRLVYDDEGPALVGCGMVLRGGFLHERARISQGRVHGELLVRAAKLKRFEGVPLAVDATAGLGEDALLLAAAGFEVHLYERNPAIAALLRDGLERAASDDCLAPIVARMTLFEQDSIPALRAMDRLVQVVLLDPMFPARAKNASAGKKLQLLQKLEQPCSDEEALLEAALSARPKKIVIKRPLKGPCLAGRKPSYSLKGTTVRYDCMVIA